MLTPTTAFWWSGKANFGDKLTPLLLERFAGLSAEWAPLHQARIVAVGSVLDTLPSKWKGIVAGTGQLFAHTKADLSHAEVFGVRGPLTARAAALPKNGHLLADPGLLADELVVVEERDVTLGLVPHWSDRDLEHRSEFLKYNPTIIRVNDDPLQVVRSIGRCHKIVTSSLHGAVIADAFGIPRRIEMAKIFAREGEDFKFRDYSESIRLDFKVGTTQRASKFRIEDLQHELFDMFEEIGAHVRESMRDETP